MNVTVDIEGWTLLVKKEKENFIHVGLYASDGKMLHSPHTGKSIEIIELQGTMSFVG